MTEFNYDKMTTLETLQNGLYLPWVFVLIPSFLTARVVCRVILAKTVLPYVNLKPKVKKNLSNSLFYIFGICLSLAYGEYHFWNESWRWVDYDDCFRGYPNNLVCCFLNQIVTVDKNSYYFARDIWKRIFSYK